MSNNPRTKLISTLSSYFVPMKHESPEQEAEWLRAMSKALEGYSADVLERTTQRIINTRKNKYFPLPAEIRHIADEYIEADNAKRLPLDGPGATSPIWSVDRQRLADALILTEQGRRAAREGWIVGLWNFALRHGRVPEHREEGKLREDARWVAEDGLRMAMTGEIVVGGKQIREMAEKWLARSDELAKRVLGE